ncbi:hypothetical protein MKW98_021702 [Papaver atlanticum]|uniref:BHLH domain-containing protein n=1 Tax=Papaver atlanticum TaxID=357466 RepID=A0AAD4SHL9_9MAGN|nr:hypothetical protein MKW98_021702 [Papaver atlanticum]
MKSCKKSDTLERKIVEKNRRIQMKALCFNLVSLTTPKSITMHQKHSSNKDISPKTDQIDDAAAYIKNLRKRIDELKRKKNEMIHGGEQEIISTNSISTSCSPSSTSTLTDRSLSSGANLPILEVKDFETVMVVLVVTGLNKNFMLYQLITVLEEHGSEVVNASFATVNDKIFHTIHSQVRCSRLGVDNSKICEGLKKFVYA